MLSRSVASSEWLHMYVAAWIPLLWEHLKYAMELWVYLRRKAQCWLQLYVSRRIPIPQSLAYHILTKLSDVNITVRLSVYSITINIKLLFVCISDPAYLFEIAKAKHHGRVPTSFVSPIVADRINDQTSKPDTVCQSIIAVQHMVIVGNRRSIK